MDITATIDLQEINVSLEQVSIDTVIETNTIESSFQENQIVAEIVQNSIDIEFPGTQGVPGVQGEKGEKGDYLITFETVSRNLLSGDSIYSTFDVDGRITSITWSNGIVKTYVYNPSSIVITLSGDIPEGIDNTKTIDLNTFLVSYTTV